MKNIIKELCNLHAPSGHEYEVRKYILNKIKSYAECKVDSIGNIIVFKKGKKRSSVKLLVDAHMDEVGFIITSVTDEGYLRFSNIGGIDPAVYLARRVIINSNIVGVFTSKPVHLMDNDERKKLPKADSLLIDIGAKNKADALQHVSPGDFAVFDTEFSEFGSDLIIAKAIDDRAGCAILINLICSESEYDFYASFSVQEEVGLRGAKTAAFRVSPESAIVLEATTAADIAAVSKDKQVCVLNKGPAISFMDGATLYDNEYYISALKTANELGIPCQPKSAVAGGNNAGSISTSGSGVRTLAISVPCRYLHSPSCIASVPDIINTEKLAKAMIHKIASGSLK